MAPAFPLPGEPVVPVRGDGDDGGVPRHSLWRKAGAPPGRGQHRGFEPRHVREGWGWEAGSGGRVEKGGLGLSPQPGHKPGAFETTPYPKAAHTLQLTPLIDVAPPF